MKSSRYLLKRTKIAVRTSFIPITMGLVLITLSILLVSFVLWSNGQSIDDSLLPIGKNLPVFYDINGNVMEYKSENFLAKEDIPNNLKFAFIALEDKRFYSHNGYDLYRIVGATIKNVKSGHIVEGASTITQQLIKNTHLSFEKTLSRKAKEIALAQKLEQLYSKDEILSMYLSVIYFGGGAYGVKSASKLYFDKDVADLTLCECATLAGIIKNPTKYSPRNNLDNAVKRRNQVLSVMQKEGYISQKEMEIAINTPLVIAEKSDGNMSKFFVEMTTKEVCNRLGITKYQLDNSGYKIYTTYDPSVQKILVENAHLTNNFSADNVDNSSIVIDNETGYILGYHSSLGYEVYTQGGSTMKPLVVYAPAIENNLITLATPIEDEAISFGGWTPKNYNDKYENVSNAREGIKQSSNTLAVRVASYVGENTMVEFGKKFGLNLVDEDKNLTLALGATKHGQSPLQIAGAYSTISRNGNHIKPSFLRFITQRDKKIYTNQAKGNQVISKEAAFLLKDCLVDTVKDGTAKALSSLPFKIASKTGTVSLNEQNYTKSLNKDAWNVSFTDQYTIAVWHGGKFAETGGGHPTSHARSIWKNMFCEKFDMHFDTTSVPDGVVSLPIDTYSTKAKKQVAGSSHYTPSKYIKWEYFKASNLPNFEKSLFDHGLVSFEVHVKGNQKTVEITLPTQEIYTYVLTKIDVLGQKQIATIDGESDKVVTTIDTPLSFGRPVIYTVEAYVKGTSHRVGQTSKTVIL